MKTKINIKNQDTDSKRICDNYLVITQNGEKYDVITNRRNHEDVLLLLMPLLEILGHEIDDIPNVDDYHLNPKNNN